MISSDSLPPLSHEELRRYGRHLILPEIGPAGQRRLKAASVLLVGAGGLGSPLALYLAAAGVGRIGLVDFDRVDASNLHRQILYGTSDLGEPKLAAAGRRLRDVNPHVGLELHEVRFDHTNALDLVGRYDVVADGTDNFATRYLVNDACVLSGKPNVYGSIYRFEGQASVFDARRGPCYRCVYPVPPPPDLVPSCAEAGVLGVLPGVIGVIQGIETLKLLLGLGESLIGRLLVFDALGMRFREMALRKDPACPICGEAPTLRELRAEDAACDVPAPPGVEVEPGELAVMRARGDAIELVDVREPWEWELVRLEGARLVPLGALPERLNELDRQREIVLYCHHGVRSLRALELLRERGFPRVRHLRGGLDAWAIEVDPNLGRY